MPFISQNKSDLFMQWPLTLTLLKITPSISISVTILPFYRIVTRRCDIGLNVSDLSSDSCVYNNVQRNIRWWELERITKISPMLVQFSSMANIREHQTMRLRWQVLFKIKYRLYRPMYNTLEAKQLLAPILLSPFPESFLRQRYSKMCSGSKMWEWFKAKYILSN